MHRPPPLRRAVLLVAATVAFPAAGHAAEPAGADRATPPAAATSPGPAPTPDAAPPSTATPSRDAAPASRCPIPEPLVLDAERLTDPNRIELSSDGAEVDEAGNAKLTGQVRVRQGDRVLEAEDASYDAASQSFAIDGDVAFRDPLVRLRGRTGTWSAATGGSFGGASFEIPSRPARGTAESITLAPDGVLGLERVEYTSCPAGNGDWYLRAGRIAIDQEAQLGTGRDVTLTFKGVPILYTPVISFPVGDARKTGFLFPAFGQSSRNGFELAAPWYWNLAPNYDATLTPGLLSKRGATLGGQFRYLTSRSRGQFDADWVPWDRQRRDMRSYLRFANRTDFTSRLRFDTALANASDTLYFEDFAVGPDRTSTLFLDRVARLTYLDEHWRAAAVVQQFQTIDRFLERDDRPYARLPQVEVRGRFGGAQGWGLELRGEGAYFTRDEGVTGARLDLEPTASWAWRRPGAFVVPALGFRATAWRLSDEATDREPTRTAPVATLDAGLVLERESGTRRQTLEPRVLYTYVPFREQSGLPLFDTGLPDLNLVELFRPQRYVGGDRLADANQVAVGATTRFVDADTGRQLVAATLGQVYYLETPRVQLPGEPSLPDRHSSDVIAELAVNAFGRWTVRLAQQWDPEESRSVRSDVRAQYAAGPGRTLGVGYRFRRGLVEQVDGTFTWPVGEAWNVYGAHTYSLRDGTPIGSFLGLEYRACCWRVRVLGRRFVSSRTGEQDTGVSVQLELDGLSNVSEAPSAFLERAVRGYSTAGSGPN